MAERTLTVTTKVNDLGSKKLTKFGKAGEKAGKSIAAGFIKAQLAIGAMKLAIRGAVRLMRSITTDAIKTGDGFAKMSRRLGVSIESLSEFAHVADLGGTSIESLGNGLKFLSKNAVDAAGGVGEAIDAFELLGIEVKDVNGEVRIADDLFLDVADSISALENSTERAWAAQRIFGRSGLDLIPVLEQGSDAIREQRKEAQRLGLTWTRTQGIMAEGAADALTRFDAAVRGIKENIAKALLPNIEAAFNKISDFLAENRQAIVEKAVGILQKVGNFMLDVFSLAARVLSAMEKGLTALGLTERVPLTATQKQALSALGHKKAFATRQREFATRSGDEAGARAAQGTLKGIRAEIDAIENATFGQRVSEQIEIARAAFNRLFQTMGGGSGGGDGGGAGGGITTLPTMVIQASGPSIFGRFVEGMEKAAGAMQSAEGFAFDLGRTFATSATQGMMTFFDSIVFGSASASEAMRSMARDIVRSLNQIAMHHLFAQVFGSLLNIPTAGLTSGVDPNAGAATPVDTGAFSAPMTRRIRQASRGGLV